MIKSKLLQVFFCVVLAFLVGAFGGSFFLSDLFRKERAFVPTPTTLRIFSEIAARSTPVSDKLFAHHFDVLYDVYFNAQVQQKRTKLLEIGLGCNMDYGPGASSKIWTQLFPFGEIWFAEFSEECTKKFWKPSLGWKFVTGDQADPSVLQDWIATTGGNFDFIIDDGGHTNRQIWNSFQTLFPNALKPGGVYFIEDLHVARHRAYRQGGINGIADTVTVPDVLAEWMQQLLVKKFQSDPSFLDGKQFKHMLLPSIERIDCIPEMCAITKMK